MIYRFIPFFFFVTILQASLNAQVAEQSGLSARGLERYESYLNQEIEKGNIPGAVSLIYRKGHIAHDKALGYNNMMTKEPMTADRIFYIQSMTKPVVSVAFMTLYEQGYFDLNDRVADYLPEFADLKVLKVEKDKDGNVTGITTEPLAEPIRIWHLLTHTAGFTHGLGSSDYDKKLFSLLYEEPYKTVQDRVAALISYPLAAQPGKKWIYSASPDVLAVLIEHFTGQTLEQVLKERIFDPLGMDDTGYNVDIRDTARVVGLHQRQEDGSLAHITQWNPLVGNTVFGGTHGLYSTVQDYLQFGKMLLNKGELDGNRIISRKTLELMTADHTKGIYYDSGVEFGLGFGIKMDVAASRLSGSEGTFYWNGAFNTYFLVDPKEDMVVILMCQWWPYTRRYSKKMRQLVYSAIDD